MKAYTAGLDRMIEANLKGLRKNMKKQKEQYAKKWFFQKYWKLAAFALICYFIGWPLLRARIDEKNQKREDLKKQNEEF